MLTKLKLAAPPVGLVTGLLTWIFGNQISGPELQTIGEVITIAFGGATTVVHGGTVASKAGSVGSKLLGLTKLPTKLAAVRKLPTSMFDTITAGTIPKTAQVVAGYVNGAWPDFAALVKLFPKARHESVATNASVIANWLDVESGDAKVADAVGWFHRAVAGGKKPGFYANRSTMPTLVSALKAAGIKRSQYKLWVADWTYNPHIPTELYDGKPAEACQWTNHALGENLDQSLLAASFFDDSTPTQAVPGGICHATLEFDLGKLGWQVQPAPGKGITFSPDDKWAAAEVQLNVHTGEWRVKPMPWNAPPAGVAAPTLTSVPSPPQT